MAVRMLHSSGMFFSVYEELYYENAGDKRHHIFYGLCATFSVIVQDKTADIKETNLSDEFPFSSAFRELCALKICWCFFLLLKIL